MSQAARTPRIAAPASPGVAPSSDASSQPKRRLWTYIAAYVALFTAFALWRWHVWSYGTDTGTFTQAIGDAFGGFRDGPEQGTHFRFHWAPLLATLYPLVAIGRTGLVLQIAQAALIALSALPLYALARAYTSARRALTYASLALLYPPLAAVAFTEFHEIAFYPAIALGLVYAADRARWRLFAALAIAGALVREEACIVLALIGIAFAGIGLLRRRTARGGMLAGEPREPERLALAGVGLAAVNALALLGYYALVIPHVGAWQPSRFYQYSFAFGPLGVVGALLAHPAYVANVLTLGRFTYLLEALVPLAFLPLFSRWSLLAVPPLLIVLLSSDPIAWRMGSHYAAIWCPWLLLGTLAALLAFERRGRLVRADRFVRASVALCIVFLIAINPMHPGHYLRPVYADTADAQRALRTVPSGMPLATHDEWFAHTAFRDRNATVFLCPYVRYAVYADDFPNPYFQSDIRPALARDVASGRARVVATYGRVHVYELTPKPGARIGNCITPGDTRYRPQRER